MWKKTGSKKAEKNTVCVRTREQRRSTVVFENKKKGTRQKKKDRYVLKMMCTCRLTGTVLCVKPRKRLFMAISICKFLSRDFLNWNKILISLGKLKQKSECAFCRWCFVYCKIKRHQLLWRNATNYCEIRHQSDRFRWTACLKYLD